MNAKSKKEFATYRKKLLFSKLFWRQTNACWAAIIWKKVCWPHSLKVGKWEFSLQNIEVLEVESLKKMLNVTQHYWMPWQKQVSGFTGPSIGVIWSLQLGTVRVTCAAITLTLTSSKSFQVQSWCTPAFHHFFTYKGRRKLVGQLIKEFKSIHSLSEAGSLRHFVQNTEHYGLWAQCISLGRIRQAWKTSHYVSSNMKNSN